MEPNLLLICLSSFIAVFILLSILAIVIKVINLVYPAKIVEEKEDSAIYAAISSATAYYFPNRKITNIEEQK